MNIEENNLSASGDYASNKPRSILKNKAGGHHEYSSSGNNRRNIKPYQKGQETVDYTHSIEMQKRKLIQMEIERARRRAHKDEANRMRSDPPSNGDTEKEFSECRGIFDEQEQIRMITEQIESKINKQSAYSYKDYKKENRSPERSSERQSPTRMVSMTSGSRNVEMVVQINMKDKDPQAITVFEGDKAEDLTNDFCLQHNITDREKYYKLKQNLES